MSLPEYMQKGKNLVSFSVVTEELGKIARTVLLQLLQPTVVASQKKVTLTTMAHEVTFLML